MIGCQHWLPRHGRESTCAQVGAKARAELVCRGPEAVVEQQAETMRWLSRRCHDLQLEVLRLTVARER